MGKVIFGLINIQNFDIDRRKKNTGYFYIPLAKYN